MSAEKLCAKEKGAAKEACMAFFDMALPQQEALGKSTAILKKSMKKKPKKKAKGTVKKALAIK